MNPSGQLPPGNIIVPPPIGTWGIYTQWLNSVIRSTFGGGSLTRLSTTTLPDGRRIQIAETTAGYLLIDVTALRAWIPDEMTFQAPFVVPYYRPYGLPYLPYGYLGGYNGPNVFWGHPNFAPPVGGGGGHDDGGGHHH